MTAVVAAAIGAMAIPAVAAPAIDTVLLEGYDSDNARLLFGVSEADTACSLEAGDYTYRVGEDGIVTLTTEDTDEAADAPAGEDTAEGDEECDLTAVDVTGPNGQVNHGQVVSSFVQALKALGFRGNGCLVRVIAQADYGKGDQQVTGADVGAIDEGLEADSMVELGRTAATCGGNELGDDRGKPENVGRPDHAGKPEDVGRPDHAGKPENVGRPDHAGKPENAGRPDHAGKPDDAGKPEGNGNGNGNGNGGGKP